MRILVDFKTSSKADVSFYMVSLTSLLHDLELICDIM